MPLAKLEKLDQCSVFGIWEISEPLEALFTLLAPDDIEVKRLNAIALDRKRKESIAARCLVKELVTNLGGVYSGVYKDEFGKPHFLNNGWQLSITHSFDYCSALIHPTKAVGIDMEVANRESLRKIAHKFLNPSEQEFCANDLTKLCIVWSAKEALYKLHGRKKLDFCTHLRVEPFELSKSGSFKGVIQAPDMQCEVPLAFQAWHDYYVCYSDWRECT